MRRIIISVAAVFVIGIIGWVCYGIYNDNIRPTRQVALTVGDATFNMGYYADMLDAQIGLLERQNGESLGADTIYYYANYFIAMTSGQIIEDEILKQGAEELGVNVTDKEIDKKIARLNWPDKKVYRDMAEAILLTGKLQEYFASQLPPTMNQTHVQVMLVESEEVANSVMSKIRSGGNFTELAANFSCNHDVEGDLGWLPRELMPNTLIANVSSSLGPNEVGSIYDNSTSKELGYWLIKVTERDEAEETVNATAILLGSMQEARKVRSELVAGGNFTALAEEYSQHESKADGGELGWLERGDMKSDAFDAVAFNLTVGDLSQPVKDESVQTNGGWWVIEVLDRGQHELSEAVKQELAQNEFEEWFDQKRESSTINDYLDETKTSWAIERVVKRRQ